jgi:large subunit ribosomal protein L29
MALNPDKLRAKSPVELEQDEQALREEIWKLRLQRATGKLQDPHKVRRTRQDLARVLTIRREIERAGQSRPERRKPVGG